MHAFLHRIELPGGDGLHVITDLPYDAATMGKLYRRRYDGEFDIRDLKVTMATEQLRARSVETVLKELYASVIAYNLTVQFRRCAAEHVGLEPRRLSFSGVWLDFQSGLLGKSASDLGGWELLWDRAIESAGKRVLPDRRGKRRYDRVSYRKRTKATQFEVRHPAEAAAIREQNRIRAMT